LQPRNDAFGHIAERLQRLDLIVEYFLVEAGVEVAMSFLTAWDRAITHIETYPDSGSLRLSEPTRTKGLRAWPVKGFPHIALYRREQGQIIVVRVLHTARDIPATLQE
jgi:toxin ParE1/3/4